MKRTTAEKPANEEHAFVTTYPRKGGEDMGKKDELLSGARVAPGEEKEDPLDFALWKAAKPGEPSWESPWALRSFCSFSPKLIAYTPFLWDAFSIQETPKTVYQRLQTFPQRFVAPPVLAYTTR